VTRAGGLRKPDFFLVGAPKCGTTALAEWLRAHPEIGFSIPKEPHFFATDRPNLRQMTREEVYLEQAFAHCTPAQRLLGEGSTHYILSQEAVPNILAFNPQARFIAMVRDPIDLVRSMHHQNVYTFVEDEHDLERAWRLQAERAAGRRIPSRCRTPELLQYASVGTLGEHVDRLLRRAGRERVHVVVFDDLVRDPRAVYRAVLAFLGVEDDGRRAFPAANERRIQSRWYRAIAGRVPTAVDRAVLATRHRLGLAPFGLRRRLADATARAVRRAPLRPELHAELAALFRPDVERLAALLERDLAGWLDAAPARPAGDRPSVAAER
jgi:hypothetical protein